MPTRGAFVAARDGLRSGEPVAAVGVAESDRQLVTDQLAAVGEDRRQAGQARSVLLADAGREPPDATVVREHGEPDRNASGAHRIGHAPERADRAKQGGDG